MENGSPTAVERRRWRRRTLVILVVGLVLVAVTLVLGHRSFQTAAEASVEEFGRRQSLLAAEAANGIEYYFKILTTALRPLAEEPEVVALEEGPTHRLLRLKAAELKRLGVWDVGVIDASGVLRHSATDTPAEGTNFSGRRYFQEAKESEPGTQVVQFIEIEALGPGTKGVLLGVPMFAPAGGGSADGRRFAGLVACLVAMDVVAEEFVAPIRSQDAGQGFLIDGTGCVLYSPQEKHVGADILATAKEAPRFRQVVANMKSGQAGQGEFRHPAFADQASAEDEPEPRLIAYAPVHVGDQPWSIGVVAPKAQALALVRSARQTQMLVVGFSTLVVLLAGGGALLLCSRLRGLLEREVERKTGQLRQSQARLRRVLDSLDALVYVADLETGEILYQNHQFQELFGDVVGRTCWEVLGVDGEEVEACSAERLVDADGAPTGVEVWEYQSGADGRWYAARDRAIRWQDHERLARLEVAVDITERRRQEQKIVEQNAQLQEKQEQIEASRRELAAATNKAAELIETAAREQNLGLYFQNPQLVTCWTVRDCSNTWCPCHGREGVRCWQIEGTYCDRETPASFTDKVLECRQCEVYRRSCPDRLTELAEGFNTMMHLLRHKAEEMRQLRYQALQRERMATIGQMAAGIAHEIDNPIASLFSLVQLLKASDIDEEAKARVALMRQCIERISKTVRQVVDFGRPVGQDEWTYGDVTKTVQDTVNLLRYDRRARKVDLAVDFEPDLPKTLVIEHQLQQVFMNIMVNALDAMDGTGQLSVRATRGDGAIEVAISDTGQGMRPEQIQHIFEPFYTTKAGHKGTGLGLALSFSSIQRHGGTIHVDSEPGKGSTFTVSIPLRSPNGGEHAPRQDSGR